MPRGRLKSCRRSITLSAMRLSISWALLVSFALTGCERPPATPSRPANNRGTNEMVSPAVPPPGWTHLDHAQPKLRTMTLWLGAEELSTEIALTTTEIATGMMFRESMAENEGMLFVFARPHRTAFYMRNTKVPLSAAYIDTEGVILEIHDLQPLEETPVPAQSDQIQFVLEVKQGWFERHNIKIGTMVRTADGSLPEVFFRRKVGQ